MTEENVSSLKGSCQGEMSRGLASFVCPLFGVVVILILHVYP